MAEAASSSVGHTQPQPPATTHTGQPCRSLVGMASLVVAAAAELEIIAAHLEFLPTSVRVNTLRAMPDSRLRLLERMLTAEPEESVPSDSMCYVAGLECEFQSEWKHRNNQLRLQTEPLLSSDTLFRDPPPTRARNARQVFWQNRFRELLRIESTDSAAVFSPNGRFGGSSKEPDLSLFADVVQALRVNQRELTQRNVRWILEMPLLTRLELHHPIEPQKWPVGACLRSIITTAPSLRELGFFHGRLSDVAIQHIAENLKAREKHFGAGVRSLRSLDFVSVKLKGRNEHVELVALFTRAAHLERVRISSTISNFDNQRLVDGILASPSVRSLSLEHNDLTDDAFAGIVAACKGASSSSPASLQQLRLTSNAISAVTLRALSRATLDGRLALERLELRNNQDISDAGIHALAPMLTPTVSRLTHLDVRNCHFGLEGALTLLSALGANEILRSLDISHNFFGSSIGDLLADFLLTNHTLTHLHANYVGLGLDGCTGRLQLALRTNQSLRVLSVGANRLRDQGAVLLMSAVASRGQAVPFEALDLSGNLITVDGLIDLAMQLDLNQDAEGDEPPPAKRQRQQRRLSADEREDRVPTIQELGLLNNDLAGCSGEGEAATRTRDALAALSQLVGKVHSNEWSGRRNVYDDEV